MAEVSESTKSNGSARPKGKPARRTFTDAEKKVAVKRVKKGEAVSVVAASIPVVDSVIRNWLIKYGAKKPTAADKRGRHHPDKEAKAKPSVLPATHLHAIRDAAGYLKHVKTDMYRLLASGEIKEFDEYHLNTLAALRRLQSIL